MAFKKWMLLPSNFKNQIEIEQTHKVGSMLAALLSARGYDAKTAQDILFDGECFFDPFLLPDMHKAVARIKKAIESCEKIAIYGDYDVDGMTATIMMVKYLKSKGAEVCYYIPDRELEGYGLNNDALDKLKADGVELVITVDNGIVAVDEAKHAKTIGLDLIITDHHALRGELPKAIAVINPFRPEYEGFSKIAGVAVAFKLILALEEGQLENTFLEYGALVCLGTIADIMPLVSENRCIVKRGLALLESSCDHGLCALKASSGLVEKKIQVRDVAFGLAPRLNATARLNSPGIALELLASEDPQSAKLLVKVLEQKNQQRKQFEKVAFEEAILFLKEHPKEQNRRIIVVCGEGWHPGVLGIVAAKLCNLFAKPCVVIGVNEEIAKGSGRSVSGFSLVEALGEVRACLIKYGGHKAAVGFTIESKKIAEFKEGLEEFAKKNFKIMPAGELEIDLELKIEDLTLANLKELEFLEPFGEGNQEPHFLLRSLVIKQIIPLSGGKHVKLRVQQGKEIADLLCFGLGITDCAHRAGDVVDAVVACNIDHYGALPRLAIRMIDLRSSAFNQLAYLNDREKYESFRREELAEAQVLRPTREDVAIVYKCIRGHEKFCDVDAVFLKLLQFDLGYGKFRVIIDMLLELKLITQQKYITVNKLADKCQIESSEIYKALC